MNTIYHIIRIILSVGTILTLIRNEKIYQAHKYTHPTNKIRYIISQIIILTLYTSSLILVSYTYRIILTKIHIIILKIMKSLILLIVTIWLLILNEEAYLTKKFIYRMNLIIILLV